MGEWTITRVVYAPQRAVELLNDMEERITRHNARVTELLEANNRYLQDARNWHIVEQLRAGDGHSVTLVNDNPDFEGPGAFVECSGDWTDWEVVKFTGDSVDAALGAAFVAFRKWSIEDAGN